jgi:hypothetical protein
LDPLYLVQYISNTWLSHLSDSSQFNYLMDNLKSSIEIFSKKKEVKSRFEDGARVALKSSTLKSAALVGAEAAAAHAASNESSQDQAVKSVRELFPELEINLVKV